MDKIGWIKESYDSETIFRLGNHHVYKEITRRIGDRQAQGKIRRLLDGEKPEEMLEYIKVYATSMESTDEKDNRSKMPGNYISTQITTGMGCCPMISRAK